MATLQSKKKSPKALARDSGLNFIEQLQIVASKPCSKSKTVFITGVSIENETLIHLKGACKMWDCPECGARNAKAWIAKIINGVNKLGGEWSFLTLTAHRKQRGIKSVSNLRDGWKKFYNRILAKTGKTAENLHFAKVWEQHADGSYHLHILIDLCLGTRWAKNNAAGVGLGYQADWRTVPNAGMVAGYIAKYTLKNSSISKGGVAWPKGLRRIETTRNWPALAKFMEKSEWDWVVFQNEEFQNHMAEPYEFSGFKIIDKRPKN